MKYQSFVDAPVRGTTPTGINLNHASHLRRLQQEAEGSCEVRCHVLRPWSAPWRGWGGGMVSETTCSVCGRYVVVNTNPAPNDIEIGGEAVAVSCLRWKVR